MLGSTPVRSEMVHLLVMLDKEYASAAPDGRRQDWYGPRIAAHFATK